MYPWSQAGNGEVVFLEFTVKAADSDIMRGAFEMLKASPVE